MIVIAKQTMYQTYKEIHQSISNFYRLNVFTQQHNINNRFKNNLKDISKYINHDDCEL